MPTTARRVHPLVLVGVVLALFTGACSSDDTDEPAAGDSADDTDEPAAGDSADETSTTSTSAPDTETTTTTTADEPAPAAPLPADVEGPIEGPGTPILPQPAVALSDGYVEEEFFVGGTAASYDVVGELAADGMWEVVPAETADFETRILVRRPPADRFSGVAIVEWFNVSAGESSPDWAYLSEEIGRSGHVYVGVSAQALGVVGGQSLLSVEVDEDAAADAGSEASADINTGGLVNLDPDRYGSLAHPGDAYAFDLFGQVGALVASGDEAVLGGLEPTTVIALGESQSAGFLTTYLNAVHPAAPAFDGFLVHSRSGSAVPLDGRLALAEDDIASFVWDGVRIRTDLDEPVLIVEAETDLTLLGYHLARQPDTDTIRTWELAGTAHADAHVLSAALGSSVRDPSVGTLLGCAEPINAGPHHEGVQAALRRLVAWIEDGEPPPTGPRLELTEGEDVAIVRDELGIAIGGVRNPIVEVPVAVYSGDAPGGDSVESVEDFSICGLFGQTEMLDRATLVALHGSADDYVAAFTAATDAAVTAGFLLPADAEQLLAEAEANRALFG